MLNRIVKSHSDDGNPLLPPILRLQAVAAQVLKGASRRPVCLLPTLRGT